MPVICSAFRRHREADSKGSSSRLYYCWAETVIAHWPSRRVGII